MTRILFPVITALLTFLPAFSHENVTVTGIIIQLEEDSKIAGASYAVRSGDWEEEELYYVESAGEISLIEELAGREVRVTGTVRFDNEGNRLISITNAAAVENSADEEDSFEEEEYDDSYYEE
ncbi:MAG: hypothetical protein ACLFQK_05245 [Fibrobacterota bacterium]